MIVSIELWMPPVPAAHLPRCNPILAGGVSEHVALSPSRSFAIVLMPFARPGKNETCKIVSASLHVESRFRKYPSAGE